VAWPVQERRVLGELERLRLECRLPASVGIVSVDLECRLHQYRLPSGFHPVMTTVLEVIAGPSGRKDATVCTSHRASSRAGRSWRKWAPRLSSLKPAAATMTPPTVSNDSSSRNAASS